MSDFTMLYGKVLIVPCKRGHRVYASAMFFGTACNPPKLYKILIRKSKRLRYVIHLDHSTKSQHNIDFPNHFSSQLLSV